MRSVLRNISDASGRAQSAVITNKVCKTLWWKYARAVCVFISTAHEVRTDAIINRALTQKKQVVVPLPDVAPLYMRVGDTVHGIKTTVRHIRLGGAATKLRVPSCGIGDVSVLRWIKNTARKPVIVLVPGLAFSSEQGARLGRGSGFYDRLLAKRLPGSPVRTVGLCYKQQCVEAVPCNNHDRYIDETVSG